MTRRRGALPARALLVAAALVLVVLGAATALAPAEARPAAAPVSIADRLGERTWALAIPPSWLAAPIPGLRGEDILDLIGTRPGERATASEIATGLRVIAADDHALLVELTEEDASAIASARARGLSLVPILRSSR